MISIKYKWFLRLFSLLCVISLTFTLMFSVYATDFVGSLEETSSNLEDELSELQSEMESLSTDIALITEQMRQITTEITQTKEKLSIAKGQEEIQYESMKQRIRYMYENGNSNLLEILLSSASMADFLKRAEFVSIITEYDHAQLEKLAETQQDIAEKEESLLNEQERLHALQEDLNQKEKLLTEKITTTSSELTQITAQLEKAKEEAEKAEEALEQEVVPIPPKEETPKKDSPKEDFVTPPTQNEDTFPDNSNPEGNGNSDNGISASVSDIELFAALIECEAGSSDYEGMLAVASVVVNRMNHPRYPDTLRGVIYQAGQFPPAHNGSVDRILNRGIKNSCLQAAQDALAGKNNVGDCLSFRSANSGHVGTIIGDNVFF